MVPMNFWWISDPFKNKNEITLLWDDNYRKFKERATGREKERETARKKEFSKEIYERLSYRKGLDWNLNDRDWVDNDGIGKF